jgi:hypothetical protein
MNFFVKITIFFSLLTTCDLTPKFLRSTIQAMTDVIETFFIQQNITYFDFILLNKSDKNGLELIDGIQAKLSPHSCIIKLIDIRNKYYRPRVDVTLNSSAVIFCS